MLSQLTNILIRTGIIYRFHDVLKTFSDEDL